MHEKVARKLKALISNLTRVTLPRQATQRKSIHISEVLILAISHVREGRGIQLLLIDRPIDDTLDTIPSHVLPPQDDPECGGAGDLEQVTDDHGPHAKGVGWTAMQTLVRNQRVAIRVKRGNAELTIGLSCRRTVPIDYRRSNPRRASHWS